MRYETARELVETILDTLLDEGTARVARIAKAKNPNKKAFQNASNKVTRSELKREVKASAVQGRADHRISHPGPSQRAGFGSYGFNESELHEATGRQQGTKKLRDMIDHHGNQVQVHAQRYNSSMDPADRAQAMAHKDAHASAIKAYKEKTGKEYYGKPLKGRTPHYIETTATHRTRSISAKGQPGGFNW